MYDLPELRGATDAWWLGMAAALRREGIGDLPQRLFRNGRLQAWWWSGDIDVHGSARKPRWLFGNGELPRHWRDPGLVLSQCCGYHLVSRYAGHLQPVGTPCYSAPGCRGPHQCSFIVVRAESAAARLADLRGAVVAYNSRDSHSGYSSLRGMIAPLSGGKRFFARSIASGSHMNSIVLVAKGAADVACVDCVSHALIGRHRPAALLGTRLLGCTMTAPGPPYVTAGKASADRARRIRAGLQAALADPGLAGVRDALMISDIVFLDRADYAPLATIEDRASALGYREVA